MITRVRVQAPVRVLDAGGWTDTWFAGHGLVCNLAVGAGTEVVAEWDAAARGRGAVLELPAFGHRYAFSLDACPGRHPLLEAVLRRWAPDRGRVDVAVATAVPPGSGLGTSASVVVALIRALTAVAGDTLEPSELARAAHRIEAVDLGLQSGVQDQLAAAHGGASLITIPSYPESDVRRLPLPPGLERRIVTVYLGAPHDSSAVHERVIAALASRDLEPLLAPLRAAAGTAAEALVDGDIDAYGHALIANTEAQAALHPGLVNSDARRVIEVARAHGAVGWKVNGAGGAGGTVSVIGPEDPGALVEILDGLTGGTVLPLRPAREGARVVDQS